MIKKQSLTIFQKHLEENRAEISKARDNLRKLQEEIEALIESCDEGLIILEGAIDTFSQYA